jgi:hypothetical protein
MKVKTMAKEPALAGQARADELRKEIDRVIHPNPEDDSVTDVATGSSKKVPTPRDFINKRMAEIDKAKSSS